MKNKKIVLLVLVFLFIGVSTTSASGISVGVTQMDGYTNYEIYDDTYNWRSLLEFPLDAELIDFNYNLVTGIDMFLSEGEQQIPVNINYKFNKENESSQRFKDTDWLGENKEEIFDANNPSIYAEAKSSMSARFLDINTTLAINNTSYGSISTGFGFQRKVFDFNIYDAFIKYHDSGNSLYIEEDVIEYNVKYNIPYTEIEYSNKLENLNYSLFLSYSPFVRATDYDLHILRDKITEGKTKGEMFSYGVGANYKINYNWLANLNFRKTSIETSGTQTQTFDDGTVYEDIKTNIFMDSTELTFSFEYKF